MSQQYEYCIKACATCDYWGGRREVKQYGDYVELDSPMDTGECYSNTSGWKNNVPVQACHSCSSWRKWSPLR